MVVKIMLEIKKDEKDYFERITYDLGVAQKLITGFGAEKIGFQELLENFHGNLIVDSL